MKNERINEIEHDKKVDEFLDLDFDSSYECKITVDDILNKTDYFNEIKEEPKPTFFQKLLKIIKSKPFQYTTLFLLFIVIGITGVLIGNTIDKTDYSNNNQQYNEYLTVNEAEIINENSITKTYIPEVIECIQCSNNKFSFYIFYGKTSNNELIYFIKYDSNNVFPRLELFIDNNKIYLTDNNLQVLTIRENKEEEKIDILDISIILKNQKLEYNIEINK